MKYHYTCPIICILNRLNSKYMYNIIATLLDLTRREWFRIANSDIVTLPSVFHKSRAPTAVRGWRRAHLRERKTVARPGGRPSAPCFQQADESLRSVIRDLEPRSAERSRLRSTYVHHPSSVSRCPGGLSPGRVRRWCLSASCRFRHTRAGDRGLVQRRRGLL